MTALVAVVLLSGPPDALAGPAPVTAAAVLAFAEAHAPRLAAARARTTGAAAAVDTGERWPEPRLMIGANPLPIETRNGKAWATAGVSQRFPWLDTLGAQREALEAQASAAERSVDLVRLDVQTAALVALHRLGASRAEAAINAEMLTIARRVLNTAEERLSVGGGQSDVIRAQVELARLETVAVDLEQAALTRAVELNAAIGRDARAPVGPLAAVAEDPVDDLDALLAAAAEHPALARHDAQLAAARARLRGAETRARPMFSVGVNYTLIGETDAMGPDPGRDALGVQVGLELPVWNGAADDAAVRAAAAAVESEQAEKQAAADVLSRRVVEQAIGAETALRRLRLYRETALPLAEQDLEVTTAAYAAGKVDFDRVLAAERTREQFAVAAVRAAADFAVARARLARAVGQPLAAGGTE